MPGLPKGFGGDDKEFEPLVDDESLDDPRFIRGARLGMDWAIEDGADGVAEHLAHELGRSWERGNNIFDEQYRPKEGK